ncbi:MAG TPA: hypothetical protein VN018_08520, partial [Brevundimonas sp.]|nr:hypothetical protein [Brevundimonas sp.]
MSYGQDFATADPANAPLDAPLYLGADPVLWGALILLLLAAVLLGWFLGSRSAPRTGDASVAIWKAIDGAAKDAMKADDSALKGRAEHLLGVVDNRLGKTLALAGGKEGLSACVKALRAAVDGTLSEKPKDGHDAPKADPDKAHHDGHGHDDKHDDHGHGSTSAVAAAAAANITINVAPSSPGKPDHDHHPAPAPRKEMTVREQTDALRLAVAAFNEHWRHEKARVRALRAALAELSGGD